MVENKIEFISQLVYWKIDLINLNFLFKKISISSDHAGFKIKETIKKSLAKNKIFVIDLGPKTDSSVDYPDFAKKVARNVASKKSKIGILICGSGTVMAISANKTKGIRAAVCYNLKSTRLCRLHNNANIISIGSRMTKKNDAIKFISAFLKTDFEGGRHLRRVKKI